MWLDLYCELYGIAGTFLCIISWRETAGQVKMSNMTIKVVTFYCTVTNLVDILNETIFLNNKSGPKKEILDSQVNLVYTELRSKSSIMLRAY